MKKAFLECGEILRIHGLNGGIIIKHYCDSYDVFAQLKNLYFENNGNFTPKKIKKVSPYKSGALVLLEGVTDADMASAIRGKTVYAIRNEIVINEGDFFIADLIGLDVVDVNTNEKYGKLKDVINSGAQDIYVVESTDGKCSYVPAIKEFVKKISLEDGIFIEPIEGMIE